MTALGPHVSGSAGPPTPWHTRWRGHTSLLPGCIEHVAGLRVSIICSAQGSGSKILGGPRRADFIPSPFPAVLGEPPAPGPSVLWGRHPWSGFSEEHGQAPAVPNTRTVLCSPYQLAVERKGRPVGSVGAHLSQVTGAFDTG